MKKLNLFKSTDIHNIRLFLRDGNACADYNVSFAKELNCILNEWLEKQQKVYSSTGCTGPRAYYPWEESKIKDKHTHRAILINIEEIEKEPCNHVPYSYIDTAKVTLDTLSVYLREHTTCKLCGIKMKAKWEPAE